jgi:hypothetical protein
MVCIMDQLLNVLILLGVTFVLAGGLRRAGTTAVSVNWDVPMGAGAEGSTKRHLNSTTSLVILLLLCAGVLALALVAHPGIAFAADPDNVNWTCCPH